MDKTRCKYVILGLVILYGQKVLFYVDFLFNMSCVHTQTLMLLKIEEKSVIFSFKDLAGNRKVHTFASSKGNDTLTR